MENLRVVIGKKDKEVAKRIKQKNGKYSVLLKGASIWLKDISPKAFYVI